MLIDFLFINFTASKYLNIFDIFTQKLITTKK